MKINSIIQTDKIISETVSFMKQIDKIALKQINEIALCEIIALTLIAYKLKLKNEIAYLNNLIDLKSIESY